MGRGWPIRFIDRRYCFGTMCTSNSTRIVSVAATPGGSGPPAKNFDASSSSGADLHVTELWFWWAGPLDLDSVSLNRTVLVVASVTVNVVETGIPCAFA